MFTVFKRITKYLQGRNLGKIPGVRRLYQFLFGIFKPQGLVVIMTKSGNKMLVDTKDKGCAPYLMINGVHEEFETELVEKHIKKGMRVVDIGAHIGYFTIIFSKLVGGGGKVYAFEPEPYNYKLLVKNIELNNLSNSNIVLECCALSDKKGVVKLFLDKSNLGNVSMAKGNIPTVDLGKEVEVETVTLDDYLQDQKVDFIKMDIQGAEGLVIDGAKEVFTKNKLKLLIEFCPYNLRNLGTDPLGLLKQLESWGFKLRVIDGQRKMLKLSHPEAIVGISKNRPEGKGWTNLFCEN